MPSVFSPSNYPRVALFTTCFFLTMTSIIGIGILSLPVRMFECGIEPFVTLFVVCCLVQMAVVVAMVELLTRVAKYQRTKAYRAAHAATSPTTRAGAYEVLEDVNPEQDWCVAPPPSPDLHTMAVLLLPKWAYVVFDFCAIFHFLAICMAYAISAGQLHVELVGIPFHVIVPVFVSFLTFFVQSFGHKMHGFVAAMTLFKGAVLVAMIALAGYVGSNFFHSTTIDWNAIHQPFILTTLALGGAANIIPVLFSKIDHESPSDISLLRNACLAALVVCWVLITTWTAIVLKIVPQRGPKPSLEDAYHRQEISTVPLLQFLREQSDLGSIGAITDFINVFCILSVTISFATLSLGLQHMLHGVARHLSEQYPDTFQNLSTSRLSSILFLSSQSLVLLVGTLFSNSLFIIMESMSSTALNIEAGVYVGVMYLVSLSLPV
eukprot:PhF_6_TR6052/c0_g1_i3/m.8768